jgi:hypothetical protein
LLSLLKVVSEVLITYIERYDYLSTDPLGISICRFLVGEGSGNSLLRFGCSQTLLLSLKIYHDGFAKLMTSFAFPHLPSAVAETTAGCGR